MNDVAAPPRPGEIDEQDIANPSDDAANQSARAERRVLAGFLAISALAGVLLALFTLISSNVPGD